MIRGNHQGPIQPIGNRVGAATLGGATWDVWIGDIGSNVISHVRRQKTNSLNLTEFTDDAVRRGQVRTSWYMTRAQFGFSASCGTNTSTTTTTTTPGGGGPAACRATHRVVNSWNTGFTAEATITDSGSSQASNWRSTWTAPAGVTVTSGWNATVGRSGSTVTASAPSWSPNLAPGQSVTGGYQATGPSSAAPTGSTLNGVACP